MKGGALDRKTIGNSGVDYFAGKIYDSSSKFRGALFKSAVCFIEQHKFAARPAAGRGVLEPITQAMRAFGSCGGKNGRSDRI
jgi:hypothetical protein